jgi:hypothetical protein
MSDEEKAPSETQAPEGETSEQVVEATEKDEEAPEEIKQRLDNAKAENARKAQEIQRLREEVEAARNASRSSSIHDPNDLSTWRDVELKAVLKDPQYGHLHDKAEEILDKRRFNRYQSEQHEASIRATSELERQKMFPETFDPSHPLAVRMQELMQNYRLENTPAGRLVAARLASSESQTNKALSAGRKQEQNRQADVNANYTGGSRPKPVVIDTAKDEELHKRAQAGDKEALYALMKKRGLA